MKGQKNIEYSKYMAEVCKSIINILENEIINSFKGKSYDYKKNMNFLTTNINTNPPGKLKDIIGRD